jgi:epoxyqueuosine reductase
MRASTTLDALRAAGLRARIVPVTRLPDLRRDIVSLLESGSLDHSLYESYLRGLEYSPPESVPNAKSIIVVGVPQPKTVISFSWKGKEVQAVVPPTYAGSKNVADMVRDVLVSAPGNSTAKFERAVVPLKTLAARCGLVRYGRNNITYLEGHGSFHRLVAFFTDIDMEIDDWQEREVLPSCDKCRMCMRACPMSAITEDRFLIHAERCLTYLNEMPAERTFPSTVSQGSHNAIIGCMICQNVCPYNRKVKDWTEDGGSFSEEETEYLLRGSFEGKKAQEIGQKLERCGLDLTTFPRNLVVLLKGLNDGH